MKEVSHSSCFTIVALFLAATLASSQSLMQQSQGTVQKASVVEMTTRMAASMNINNLWTRVWNDGNLGRDTTVSGGMTYPLFNGGILYRDNLVWVGKVNDGGSPLIRTGGGTYWVGVLPGSIVSKGVAEDTLSESVRVFRHRPGFETGELTIDAAASRGIEISKVETGMIDALRQQYAKDLAEWPWQKGAPFVDQNENGRMDPGERPGLQNAGQVLWLSYNDLDPRQSRVFAGDPPIGVEVQLTLWAYHGVPNLEDVIFKRYRVIYKGTSQTPTTARIDSMYLTQWFDPDIGNASDDLAGCDSALSLGYGYNMSRSATYQDTVYKSLHLPTPGIGYALLQGPLVPAESGESGTFGFRTRPNSKNLPMTACVIHVTGFGDAFGEPPFGSPTNFYWNTSRGCQRNTAPFHGLSYSPIVDPDGKATKFMYNGDPVTLTGWTARKPKGSTTDGIGGDPRVFMSMGPFTMALGDTQEVVLAVIASAAPTVLENVTWLKNRAVYIHGIYPNLGDYVAGFVTSADGNSGIPVAFHLDQNYPNPFNPATHISFTIPNSGEVRLSVFDLLGQEIRVLSNGSLPAGEHIVAWDGRDALGNSSPSGVYFYRLTFGDRQSTRKLLLLR